MKVATFLYNQYGFIKETIDDGFRFEEAQILLGFGAKQLLNEDLYIVLKNRFPNTQIALCSTAGEIYHSEVMDDVVSITAITFHSSQLQTGEVAIKDFENSLEAGKALLEKLPKDGLKLAFILSDGSKVNGSELVRGMNMVKSNDALITGGLAGDGTKFEETLVGLNTIPESGKIVAIGFYGDKLQFSHGSLGGWESFGLEREVTKANANVLYEIDQKNALDLYKKYLGKYADELPGSALLFPLSMSVSNNEQSIVRTILSIDENDQSMTFAGDIPVGSKVRFMKANFDRLIDAASDAAVDCTAMNNTHPQLALLVSCVGRKIILANRIDEEVEAVADIFGSNTTISGFYSYGEISPLKSTTTCELHNQTMTITGIQEIE
jgi:hypothetical protein